MRNNNFNSYEEPKIRNYTELSRLRTFQERFDYLVLNGVIFNQTFGDNRYLNQNFYRSREWRQARNRVIERDNACDLGIIGRDIRDKIYVHHMNPITIKQVLDRDPIILDTRYLISCSELVHKAIHFGDPALMILLPQERRPNDTSPWKK